MSFLPPKVGAKHPHVSSTIFGKENMCFQTQEEKLPGWQADIRRALLHTQRFLSDLAIIDHPTSPPPPPPPLRSFPGLSDLLIAA